MKTNEVVVSVGTYEGGLMGLSASSSEIMTQSKEKLKKEFSFVASTSQISCMASVQNLLALGGTEEVIKLFDLKTKKSVGELAGVHESSVTCLAISRNCKYVFSGAEDGLVVIWRVKDQEPLHQLKIKNVSKVVSLSMHNSGRMLLALYANGMVRLWSMLDARCIFKKKAGIDEDSE